MSHTNYKEWVATEKAIVRDTYPHNGLGPTLLALEQAGYIRTEDKLKHFIRREKIQRVWPDGQKKRGRKGGPNKKPLPPHTANEMKRVALHMPWATKDLGGMRSR
jgi:hypothetical protein